MRAVGLGLRALNQGRIDLVGMVTQETGGAGAEMTIRLPRTRGRMVVAASGVMPLAALITRVCDLSELGAALGGATGGGEKSGTMSVLDLFRLDGKTALVTGARRGIGKAMALRWPRPGPTSLE